MARAETSSDADEIRLIPPPLPPVTATPDAPSGAEDDDAPADVDDDASGVEAAASRGVEGPPARQMPPPLPQSPPQSPSVAQPVALPPPLPPSLPGAHRAALAEDDDDLTEAEQSHGTADAADRDDVIDLRDSAVHSDAEDRSDATESDGAAVSDDAAESVDAAVSDHDEGADEGADDVEQVSAAVPAPSEPDGPDEDSSDVPVTLVGRSPVGGGFDWYPAPDAVIPGVPPAPQTSRWSVPPAPAASASADLPPGPYASGAIPMDDRHPHAGYPAYQSALPGTDPSGYPAQPGAGPYPGGPISAPHGYPASGYPEAQNPNNQYPNNQYANNQYADGQYPPPPYPGAQYSMGAPPPPPSQVPVPVAVPARSFSLLPESSSKAFISLAMVSALLFVMVAGVGAWWTHQRSARAEVIASLQSQNAELIEEQKQQRSSAQARFDELKVADRWDAVQRANVDYAAVEQKFIDKHPESEKTIPLSSGFALVAAVRECLSSVVEYNRSAVFFDEDLLGELPAQVDMQSTATNCDVIGWGPPPS